MNGKEIKAVKTNGVQYERDLQCCQQCSNDPDCDVWVQGTDWANTANDVTTCILKKVTVKKKGETNLR